MVIYKILKHILNVLYNYKSRIKYMIFFIR
jgi:hypothetical protein